MRTTLQLLLLYFLLMMLPQFAAAQSDFREGYVVLASGDTLHGEVNYRSLLADGNVCVFQPAGQSNKVTYTPQDIRGYGFPNDKSFQSKHLDHADTLAAEDVFMEELVRGTISLYNYRGTFFVQKQPELNLHKLYFTNEKQYTYAPGESAATSTGTLAVRRVNHHISTLNMLMQDCFKMIGKTERVSLNQRSLVAVVQEYNQCAGDQKQIVFKAQKPWLAVQAGVMAGISRTSLSFSATDEHYLHLEHSRFNHDTYPVAGLMISFNSPRVSEQLSLQLEAHYFSSQYSAHSSYEWFDNHCENDVSFNLSAINGSALFRYNLGGTRFQPFINAGSFINFYHTRGYKHKQYVTWAGSSTPEERVKDDPEFVARAQRGLLAGAGTYLNLKNRKFSVELRYAFGADIHEHKAAERLSKSLDSNTKTISLLAGFYF